MKKSIKFLTLLMASTTILSTALLGGACGKNSSKDEIVIWAWNKNVDAINASIQRYKDKVDSDFDAHVESFARLDIDKKFKTASQNGRMDSIADIVLCDGMNVLTYYDLWSDIFTDLSSYVSDKEKGNLVQSTLKTVETDGKLLGLPLDIAPTVVFANKNLWNNETLNKVMNEGWTWEEYLQIGMQIKEKNGNDIFMTSYNMRGDDRIYRAMVSQKGQWFMDKDYNVFVDNDNSIKAMTTVKEMYDVGVVGHIDTGDYKSLMKNGKIAAQVQGFFLGGQLKDVAPEMSGELTVLPLPKWTVEDKNSASITGGSYFYVNQKVKGEKKNKAIDFVKYMTLNKESSIENLKIGGIYPAVVSAYSDEYFMNTKDEFFVNNSVWKDVANWSVDAKAIFATKYNGLNYDLFIKSQEKILFTKDYSSIGEVLTETANKMRNNVK